MFVKNIDQCHAFTANDGCTIREWLHPGNDPIELPYSVAEAVVEVGPSSYKHKLKQTELYLILSGQGNIHVDEETKLVKTGDCIVIPSESIQWIENVGNEQLRFLALVNPPWSEKDDIRIK